MAARPRRRTARRPSSAAATAATMRSSAPTYMKTSAAVTRSASPGGSDQRLQVGLGQPVIDAFGLGLLQHRGRDVAAFEECRERPQPLAHQPGAAAEIDRMGEVRSSGPARSPRREAPARGSRASRPAPCRSVAGILVEQRLDEGAGRRDRKPARGRSARASAPRRRGRPGRASAPCARPRPPASSAPAASCISPMRNQPSAQPGASSSAPSISSAAGGMVAGAEQHLGIVVRGGRPGGRRRYAAAVSSGISIGR